MIPRSIRWRLPLTYAAIALLAILALGAVLLVTLRSYYSQQETDYLEGNAEAVGATASLLLAEGVPLGEALHSHLKGFSFLCQCRVRVLAVDGEVLADSGDPRESRDPVTVTLGVDVGGLSQKFAQTVEDVSEQGKRVTSRIDLESEGVRVRQSIVIQEGEVDSLRELEKELAGDLGLISGMPTLDSRSGFELNPYAAADGSRSGQVVSRPLYDARSNLLEARLKSPYPAE